MSYFDMLWMLTKTTNQSNQKIVNKMAYKVYIQRLTYIHYQSQVFLGEDTLWNISFRLFHKTQFNAYFITFKLISWNSYKICKKETSKNHHKKKCHIPMFATSPCCGHWLTVSHEKVILTGDCFFHYFTRDKNAFVYDRIQGILSIK